MMTNSLNTLSSAVSFILRDRSQTLEQYIIANNPQNTAQVEHLERQYTIRNSLGKLV
jgi:hypothetical protein